MTISNAQVRIIPQPMEVTMGNSTFKLDQKTAIITNLTDNNTVQFLSDFLEEGINHKPKIKNRGKESI